MEDLKLSVIVPAHNEAQTIERILNDLLLQKDVMEVIVVDDASTDETAAIVKKTKSKKIHFIQHQKNQGKGKAIQSALELVKGNYILIQDADLEYDPKEIPLLTDPVKNGRASVVYGSRFTGAHTNMFYWHYLGNKFLNFVVNIFYNSILSDMETCYKLIPADLFRSLNISSNDFRIEPEITCKLLRRKVKILEVPITYVGRTYQEGKKITWRDGFKALDTIVSIRFGEFR